METLLTEREQEVLKLMLEGRSDSQIAECIYIKVSIVNVPLTMTLTLLGTARQHAILT